MDAAGAGVQRDVVAVEDDGIPVEHGVLGGHPFKRTALEDGQHLGGLKVNVGGLADRLGQVLGQDIDLAVGGLEEHVVILGVEADGHVARDGPGRGGPDDEVGLAQVGVPAQLALVVPDGELDEQGGAGVVLVFDLGLGQGGLVMGAPVHRLHALIDKALFRHLAKDLHLLGLKGGLQGQVGVVPLAQHAQALELLPLLVHEAQGVLLALLPELAGGQLVPLHLLVLQDGGLDGQAVGVPAGHVGGAVARHVLLFDNDVLEDLVQGRADVDAAVGIGGAVVEDEEGLAVVAAHHLVVEVLVVHGLEHLGLPLGQTRPHGEVGLGQMDGLVVVHGCVSPSISSIILPAWKIKSAFVSLRDKGAETSAVPLFLPRGCRGRSRRITAAARPGLLGSAGPL